jgi:hypothetical protein
MLIMRSRNTLSRICCGIVFSSSTGTVARCRLIIDAMPRSSSPGECVVFDVEVSQVRGSWRHGV